MNVNISFAGQLVRVTDPEPGHEKYQGQDWTAVVVSMSELHTERGQIGSYTTYMLQTPNGFAPRDRVDTVFLDSELSLAGE